MLQFITTSVMMMIFVIVCSKINLFCVAGMIDGRIGWRLSLLQYMELTFLANTFTRKIGL